MISTIQTLYQRCVESIALLYENYCKERWVTLITITDRGHAEK